MRIELFVEDVQESVEFYTQVLGFSEANPASKGGYHVLRFGGSQIAVQSMASLESTHPLAQKGLKGLGVEIVIEVDHIHSLHEQVKSQHSAVSELKVQTWGLTDFRITDPDGYYLRFTTLKAPTQVPTEKGVVHHDQHR